MSQRVKLAERVISASRAAKFAKASRLGIVVTAVLTFLIFAISYYGEVVGNFTFSVDRQAQEAGISMYEDDVVKDYTSRLIAGKVEGADGMTIFCGTEYTVFPIGDEVCLPSDEEIASVNGPNNGENFLGYTFYVENTGQLPLTVASSINIISTARGAEEAIRVKVIINGVATTYAMRQSENGDNPEALEPFTEAFYGPAQVMYQEVTSFQPGDVLKITVIIWYEGEDADHTNDIQSGGVKMDMQFTVIEVYDIPEE